MRRGGRVGLGLVGGLVVVVVVAVPRGDGGGLVTVVRAAVGRNHLPRDHLGHLSHLREVVNLLHRCNLVPERLELQ